MSWFPRSIATTLLIDGDDPNLTHSSIADHDHPQFSKQIHHQIQNLEIKDHDHISTVNHVSDRDLSGEDDDCVSSNSDHGGSGFRVREDEVEKIEAVGVREEALAFARNISHHPETWLDFPLSEEEDDDDFEMSDTQWNHVTLVELLAPRLAALRIELCPIHMSESYFWKVYFVLLHPRLNKHDADLLSTPQIVAARSMWMKELQKRTKPNLKSSETNTSQSHGSSSTHHDFSTASELPSANMSFETSTNHTVADKYSFTSKKSISQEVGSTKTSINHMPARSYIIPIEDDDDDDDDWIHENSELNGYVGPDVQFGTDEDISFSDLEADDDCTMPVRSKII
ncbi:hypothetical protein SSX86_015077 [Deinandra increscens subsp. villosa]|uniref:BSD domain-containing protein n=1 Tax=Deinandra increscens subsp. villosa TaxID=3103831 RepID=A0AAP0D0T2_9ASTR